jgi:Neuraminidase (sialidase)
MGGIDMKQIIVAYDRDKWCAVPANNGGNSPSWQWGNELLIGYTCGQAQFTQGGHQVDYINPHVSMLARSKDGGETWQNWEPTGYQGDVGFKMDDAVPLPERIKFTAPGFVMRVEGYGYHGNFGQQWFYSQDKGNSWNGPYTFGNLLNHPELTGKQFTGRTAYLINGPYACFLFLSVRDSEAGSGISTTEKVFLAQTIDGGVSFEFISWIVPPSDPHRAAMPAPVRISENKLVTAIRRRGGDICWIDCCYSLDNGQTWSFLSRVGDTGSARLTNGNPPALIRMGDDRLCCVFGDRDRRVMLAKYSEDEGKTWGSDQILYDDFESINGFADLGYPRLFQRPDGKLVTVYFWCSTARPETHIVATIFEPEV